MRNSNSGPVVIYLPDTPYKIGSCERLFRFALVVVGHSPLYICDYRQYAGRNQ